MCLGVVYGHSLALLSFFLAILVFENLEDGMLALNGWDPFPCISGWVGGDHYISLSIGVYYVESTCHVNYADCLI